MAKNDWLLYGAKGKLGNIVTYHSNGRQLVRARNFSPSNPKTARQAYQRMVLAAVTSYVRAFKTVVNNTFDGQKNGGLDLNAFRRIAMKQTRTVALNEDNNLVADFLPKGTAGVQPVEGIQVSQGDAAPLRISLLEYDEGTIQLAENLFNEYAEPTTYIEALSGNNLTPGDQITILAVYQGESGIYLNTCARMVFKSLDAITFPTESAQDIIAMQEGCYGADNDIILDTPGRPDGTEIAQIAIIRTTVVDGKFVHSTSFMHTNSQVLDFNSASEVYESYMDISETQEVQSEWYTEQASSEGTATPPLPQVELITPAGGFPFDASSKTVTLQFQEKPDSVFLNMRYLTTGNVYAMAITGDMLQGGALPAAVELSWTTAPSYDDSTNRLTATFSTDGGRQVRVMGGVAYYGQTAVNF